MDPTMRQSKFWIGEPNRLRAYNLLRLDKESFGTVVQFLTGHGFLRRHTRIIQIESNTEDEIVTPECRLCNSSDETPIHLANECQETWPFASRTFKLQEPGKESHIHNWTVARMKSFINLEIIQGLIHPDSQTDPTQSQPTAGSV